MPVRCFSIYFARLACAQLAIALALACPLLQADELLSGLFSDHMVIQRSVAVPVWGWAAPGETVTVSIDGQSKTAQADKTGKWMVRLDPMRPGAPRRMAVKSASAARDIADILVGDVWLASGQSNMAWPLKQAVDGAMEVARADFPAIRFFNIPTGVSPAEPSERLPPANPRVANMNAWTPVTNATAAEFSAVAYFFALDLHRSLGVPVGIISNAVGGSPIEAWTSRDALKADAEFRSVADYFDGLANYVEKTPAGKRELADLTSQYATKQAALRASGKPQMWPPSYPSPLQSTGFGSTLYNALVHPLVPYALRGVIWYQGEAQWDRMYEYRGIFPLLISDWRKRWERPDLPFLYVQLPNWSRPNPEPDPGGWAWLREAQLLAARIPGTGMAVAIELGEAASVHPLNKQDVGQRLALAARRVAYGENVEYSGPLYKSMKIGNGAVILSFDHVGSGLMVGRKEGRGGAVEDKEGKLRRFSIAGEDMKFVWADAQIRNDTVVVSAPSVPTPVAVRYAWENNPEGCNLYNREGLPASPFRTDESHPVRVETYFRSRLEKGFSLQPQK